MAGPFTATAEITRTAGKRWTIRMTLDNSVYDITLRTFLSDGHSNGVTRQQWTELFEQRHGARVVLGYGAMQMWIDAVEPGLWIRQREIRLGEDVSTSLYIPNPSPLFRALARALEDARVNDAYVDRVVAE